MKKSSKGTDELLDKSCAEADAILYEYFKNNRYPKRAEKQRLAEKTNVTIQYVVNFFYNARSRIRKMEKQSSAVHKKGTRGLYSEFRIKAIDQHYLGYTAQYQEAPKFRGYQNNLYISEPRIERFLLTDGNHENISNSELPVCDGKVPFKDNSSKDI